MIILKNFDRVMDINSRQSQINPLFALLFLIAPVVSAWAWQYGANDAASDPDTSAAIVPSVIPVENTVSDDTPKWVLVPTYLAE